ncbi:alpha/beta hydrolase [Umezawaea endophytica]|uniref:Alpha/beta hydrolase n=1 Tax=Umezawaea endophytica TaxID=1654476 RepID=A0A9X2VHR5_9PSEU|nr:alpha/beta hydrolase [Umezawaea endophytica]MCS7476890.1 alpha/beta hydrolase [Umezawaea endophytica]
MRRTSCVLVMVMAAAGVSAPAAQARETRPEWSACSGAPAQECATVEVPLDYRKPRGKTISLAISRIRTAKPGSRRGVLLLIPGGPGNPGLSRPTTHGSRLPQEVLDRYDLVGFDPRGVGRSTPVTCDLTGADADPQGFLPWPGVGGDITESVAKAKRVARACGENGGELMRHISTRDEARDIDRIRQALDERALSYWGVSYGTYVGAVYATMFPERTDRVVLDSNDDPDPRMLERGWLNNFAIGARDRFPDFAVWAAERDDTYGLGATPDAVTSTYLDLAAALDENPRPGVTGNYLRAAMFAALYSDANFPLLAQIMAGGPPSIPVPPPAQFQNGYAVLTATGCNDVDWPRSVDHYARAVAENRREFPLTAGMPVNIMACAFWPYRAEKPVTVTSHGPENILLVQNLRDPATPYAGAVRMLEALGHRARMVTVDAGGHGSYLANGNPCGDDAVTAFLTSGTHENTTC